MQIQAREPGMERLVELLQQVLAPGLNGVYYPPANVLTALHNALMQISDYPPPPALAPVRCESDRV